MTAAADEEHAAQPVTRWLVMGLAVLTALAVVLSRRSRTPTVSWLSDSTFELAGHIAVAFVLTLVAVRLIERTRVPHPALVGLAFVVLVTTVVEVAQVPLRDRSASVEDLVANTTGALLGGAVAVGIRRLRPVVAGRVVVATMVLAAAGGAWGASAGLDVDDCNTAPAQLGLDTPPVPGPPLDGFGYSYDLAAAGLDASNPNVPERNGGPSLEAMSRSGTGPPATIFEGAFLMSPEAGRSLSSNVLATDRLFVEVIATPSDATRGPARIVAITDGVDTDSTNVHVSQHGDELSVRLRLTCGEFNWTRIDEVFVPGERRHIVVTFAEATQRVWVNGALVDERRFTDDVATTANWVEDRPLVVGNTPGGNRPFVGDIDLVTIVAGP